MKILMVCLGNICRSPMAHGLLQHKVELNKLDWEVDSAGEIDYHEGELPDQRACACMKKHGIDIQYQRSRPFSYDDIKGYDLIYAMDRNNFKGLINATRDQAEQEKIKLIMSEVNADNPEDVPDPYFTYGDQGFERVFKMLDQATDKIIEKYGLRS